LFSVAKPISLLNAQISDTGSPSNYKKCETDTRQLPSFTEKLDQVTHYGEAIYAPHELAVTNWSRFDLFYIFFTVIGHYLFGLSGLNVVAFVPGKYHFYDSYTVHITTAEIDLQSRT
jgi:hypothetical protein